MKTKSSFVLTRAPFLNGYSMQDAIATEPKYLIFGLFSNGRSTTILYTADGEIDKRMLAGLAYDATATYPYSGNNAVEIAMDSNELDVEIIIHYNTVGLPISVFGKPRRIQRQQIKI